jgi:salicylate hydroxylase
VSSKALIIGGGIGGLTAALALSRVNQACAVFEQAATFGEIGAGLQLGPNAMRRLHAMGLAPALAAVAAFPKQLQVRSAASGAIMGALPLGEDAVQRYGAPYATLHRGDLHAVLLAAVQATPTQLRTGCEYNNYSVTTDSARIIANRVPHEGAYVVGADGLRSSVRQQLLGEGDGAPRLAGQVVYRALVQQNLLPFAVRTSDVTVWLGPHLHVVVYPLRSGAWLNVAAIVHGQLTVDSGNWDQTVHAVAVRAALKTMCAPLNDLIHAVPDWRAWNVYDRPAMTGASQHAQGRVALLGDAAHPMRPYLAQGAGMAIEDAAVLADAVKVNSSDIPSALQRYAHARWQRNAQVQRRAQRNGHLFHLPPPLSWARDAGIALLGKQVLDVPWLYRY